MTVTLEVDNEGQIALPPDVLSRLGVEPGDKVEFTLLQDGTCMVRAAQPADNWDGAFGMLAGMTDKVATIEEINEAIIEGWAGETKA